MNINTIKKQMSLLTILLFCSVQIFSQTKTMWLSVKKDCVAKVVSVEVRAKNFTNVVGFQGSLNWDTTQIKYTGTTTTTNISGLTQANFYAVSGKFAFLWVDNTTLGTTVSDSTLLFTLKFAIVNNANGTAGIFFSNNPTKLQIDTTDGNYGYPAKYMDTAFISGSVNLFTITQSVTVSGCNSATYKGITYYAATVVTDTTKSVAGCDSIYKVATITVTKITPVTQTVTVSGNDSLVYKGIKYYASTVRTDTIKSVGGCDSVYITTTINVTKTVFVSRTKTLWLSQTGNSCTSATVTVNVRTKNFSNVDVFQGSINWDTTKMKYTGYTIPGGVVNNSNFNVNSDTSQTNHGRFGLLWADLTLMGVTVPDSTTVLTLKFNVVGNATGATKIMFGNKPTKQEIDTTDGNYGNPGIFKDTAFIAGNINLGNIIPVTQNVAVSGCNSVVYKGITYTSSTVRTDTIKSIGGCDSVYNIASITIVKIIPTTTYINVSGCGNVVYKGGTYSISTIRSDTTKSVQGCDSVYTLATITVNKITPTTIYISQSGCNSLVYKGVTYTSSTLRTDTTKSVQGCDSIYTIATITVNKVTPTTINVSQTGCNSVVYKGITYTSSTVRTDTTKSVQGCDSIYTVATITVNKSVTATINKTVCSSYLWHGVTYTVSGTYTYDTLNAKGCDSLTTLNLTINKPTTATINKVACGSYLWHGVTYTISGTYTYDTLNAKGCDSLTTLNLTINSPTTSTTNITISSNQLPYIWNGLTFNAAGTQTVHLTNAKGCDSTATLILTVTSSQPKTLYIAQQNVCNAGIVSVPVLMKNMKRIIGFQGSVNYDQTIMKYSGITNSITNVNFSTLDTAIGEIGFLWNDTGVTGKNFPDSTVAFSINFTVPANYTGKTLLSFGSVPTSKEIDTIDTNTGLGHVTTDTAFINGFVKFTGINSQSVSYATICSSSLPFKWNGLTFDSSGTQTVHFTNATGCDSAATMVLTVKPKPSTNTINLNSCDSVMYKNTVFKYSTAFSDTVRSSGGCDSVYNTVNITITNVSISGGIYHPSKGYIIPNVSVLMTGSTSLNIVSTGNYRFNCLANGVNETIRLNKNNDVNKANGVTALDIAFVQSHILGKSILNSPYKIIAADVSGDGKVTALDIVYMKRLILGIDTSFTSSSTKQSRLWAFVDSSYNFTDNTNPFPYKDSISYTGLSVSKTNQTFIGCKLGDVNWDWNPAVARPMVNNENLVELYYSYPSDALAGRADGVRIPVRVKNFKDMLGIQFTISFDHTVLQWQGMGNNPLGIETGTTHAAEGSVSFLWVDQHNNIKTLDDGSVVFELVFKKTGKEAIGKEAIGNTLSLDGSVTAVAAYDKDYGVHNVVMSRVENVQPLQTETWTVAPNPTKDGVIQVMMNLADNKAIVFRLIDNTGRVLLVKQVEGVKGSNNITLREGNIPGGTYYLQAVGVEGVKQLRIEN